MYFCVSGPQLLVHLRGVGVHGDSDGDGGGSAGVARLQDYILTSKGTHFVFVI